MLLLRGLSLGREKMAADHGFNSNHHYWFIRQLPGELRGAVCIAWRFENEESFIKHDEYDYVDSPAEEKEGMQPL